MSWTRVSADSISRVSSSRFFSSAFTRFCRFGSGSFFRVSWLFLALRTLSRTASASR